MKIYREVPGDVVVEEAGEAAVIIAATMSTTDKMEQDSSVERVALK